ncbi:hypothetical protein [Lentzea sp. CA-135723]|uniref:hypothetical protein n=1 Tax=Lentzea sp. CA-135723 TaxID=3239950 RepID=UPI003D91C78D
MITDAAARRAAINYHNGQASPSYSFVSTGTISDPAELVRDLHRGLEHQQLSNPDLVALVDYINRTGARGPVTGWSQLWD